MTGRDAFIGINASAHVTRAGPCVAARDSKTFHGERTNGGGAIVANARDARAAKPFHIGTACCASGFAAQVIAQALKVPRATALEGTRGYEEGAASKPRLIKF